MGQWANYEMQNEIQLESVRQAEVELAEGYWYQQVKGVHLWQMAGIVQQIYGLWVFSFFFFLLLSLRLGLTILPRQYLLL